jgi:hypothetical protein
MREGGGLTRLRIRGLREGRSWGSHRGRGYSSLTTSTFRSAREFSESARSGEGGRTEVLRIPARSSGESPREAPRSMASLWGVSVPTRGMRWETHAVPAIEIPSNKL